VHSAHRMTFRFPLPHLDDRGRPWQRGRPWVSPPDGQGMRMQAAHDPTSRRGATPATDRVPRSCRWSCGDRRPGPQHLVADLTVESACVKWRASSGSASERWAGHRRRAAKRDPRRPVAVGPESRHGSTRDNQPSLDHAGPGPLDYSTTAGRFRTGSTTPRCRRRRRRRAGACATPAGLGDRTARGPPAPPRAFTRPAAPQPLHERRSPRVST
jgi:hypothetical protein